MGQMIERLPPRLADGLLALAVLGAASPWLGRWLAMADLLAQFLLQITVATFGLAVLMLVARRWRRAGLAMACLVVQLATLNPDLSSAAVADDSGVRVVALNLWIDNPRPRTTLAYLRGSGADIIVLSEIYEDWRAAVASLADTYPYRVDCIVQSGCDVAILSKLPVLASRGLRDPDTGAPYVEARIAIRDGAITVVATHLVRPFGNGTLDQQLKQIRYVTAHMKEISGPRMLIGDFNAVGWGRVIRFTGERSGLRLLRTIDGTWPAPLPWPLRIPIDNALVSSEIGSAVRRTGPAVGSDHHPIVITLRLGPS